jgi:acyl-CoA reductase-like NAD-dependent aldehyde dehydrogenase
MTTRLDIAKTYKLFINGVFPRSESGRTLPFMNARGEVLAHISHASRKDLRDAVEAARAAQTKWANATAYNRGQILYRMAEMMEGKRDELAIALTEPMQRSANSTSKAAAKSKPSSKVTPAAAKFEVAAAIDRMVHYAGWCDKYAQVLGCNNPVSGPFYNFTSPEASGVAVCVCPDTSPLLALVSLMAPALVPGNSIIVVASEANPLPGVIMGEVCTTSDVPAGVINILTGQRAELLSHIAGHRDIDAIHAGGLTPAENTLLREGAAENLKRVTIREAKLEAKKSARQASANTTSFDWTDATCNSPWWIESFVDFKTMWHPAAS